MEGCSSVKESNNMSFTDYEGRDAISEYYKLKDKLCLDEVERFNLKNPTMNDDIKEYGVLGLTHNGELVPIPVYSTADYDHFTHQIHHYIKQQNYSTESQKKWFADRGIEQKLILLPVWVHNQVHNTATTNYSDKEFERRFKISRWDLLFNRRYSEY